MYPKTHILQSIFAALLCLLLLSACAPGLATPTATTTERPGSILSERGRRAHLAALAYVSRWDADFAGERMAIDPWTIPGTNDLLVCFTHVAVRYSESEDGVRVYPELMPLSELLGYLPESPLPEQDLDWFEFVATGDDGYMVLSIFKEYIDKHGRLETSGPPIDHGGWMDGEKPRFRQCFKNYCLIVELIDGAQVVSVENNGQKYCNGLPVQGTATVVPGDDQKTVNHWFNMPAYNNGAFEFGVFAYSDLSGLDPIPGVQTMLTLSAPFQETKTYVLPPTGANGQSVIPLTDFQANDHTTISARVCINSTTTGWYCYSVQELYRSLP